MPTKPCAAAKGTVDVTTLPLDILIHIGETLDPASLVHMAATCHTLRLSLDGEASDFLWKLHVHRRFPRAVALKDNADVDSYRALYQKQVRRQPQLHISVQQRNLMPPSARSCVLGSSRRSSIARW